MIIRWEEGWPVVEKGIIKLRRILDEELEPEFSSNDCMELYTIIYEMCTQKSPHDYSQQLYDKYKLAFKEYMTSTVLPSLRKKHDELMLRELVKKWSNHKIMVGLLSQIFRYLDRYFVKLRLLPGLNEVGLTFFRDMVYQELKHKARDVVIAFIDRERKGEQIDRAFLKNLIDIFVEIGMGKMYYYENDFEDYMLKDSTAYYSRNASNWSVEYSCADYMLKAEECLSKEKDRVAHYLHSSSELKLLESVRNQLVVHSRQLLEKEDSGCRALLQDDKVEDLSRIYRLLSKSAKELVMVANVFKQHIAAEGIALVQQAKEAASNRADNVGGRQKQAFVRKVIELHDKYMGYVSECFLNHHLFYKAMKEAFEVFCNNTVAGCSSAELLASFCDNILEKGESKELSDEAIKETLDKVVKLLAYISDKDPFAEFHRKKLSQRLLSYKSANYDLEMLILRNLKQQYGKHLTSNMERMMMDWTLAKDYKTEFKEYCSGNPNACPGIKLTVSVLTTASWPISKSSSLSIPLEMEKCLKIFEDFYKTKMKHRKLTWIYSQGTCLVDGNFNSKHIELIVGTYQAAGLLLFNTSNKLSYLEIKTQLNLADDDLIRLLHSLSCAKYKILIKEPNSRTISKNDSFEFNSLFTYNKRRIRIPLPAVDEGIKAVEVVDHDRRYTIEASLIRIMKSQNALDYQHLVKECMEQLSSKFKPDLKAVQVRIEHLITRDYLKRAEKNYQMLEYLA